MTWILFIWMYVSPGRTIGLANQEFNSHAACVQAARSIEANFGQSTGFLCIQKGDAKDDIKKIKKEKKNVHAKS